MTPPGEPIAETTFEAGKAEFEKAFPLEGVAPEDLAKSFADRYHPSKYQEAIRKYVERITNKDEEEKRSALTTESVRAYTTFYDMKIRALAGDASKEKSRFEDAQEAIRDWTRGELDLLKGQVEASRGIAPTAEAAKAAPAAPYAERDWLARTPVISSLASLRILPTEYEKYLGDKAETHNLFAAHLDALDSHYINYDRQKRDLIDRFGEEAGKDRFDRYEELAEQFKKGVHAKISAKIELIFFDGATPAKLEALQKEIHEMYASCAGRDQNKEDISLEDLDALAQAARSGVDTELLLHEGNDNRQQIIARLEQQHLMNPEIWIANARGFTERLIATAVNNGQSDAVIDFVKKYYEGIGRPKEDLDFKEARKELIGMTERAARSGVKETLAIWEGANGLEKIANGSFTELVGRADERIRVAALRERASLLTGEAWPPNEPDRLVVAFVRSNFEGRQEILSDESRRTPLLSAIKIATVDYADALKKSLPTGSRKLSGRALEDPARLQALVLLGQEAEVLVKRFGHEEAYKQIKERMTGEAPYPPDLRFGSVKDSRVSARYVSPTSMGGFNGADMGCVLLKVVAGATLAANVFSSKLDAYKNPYFLAAVGVLGGFHFDKRMPGGLVRYPLSNEAERSTKSTYFYLNGMCRSADFSKDEVADFCRSSAEFDAIRGLKGRSKEFNPEPFKKLVEAAGKRDPRIITIKDMETAGVPKERTLPLPADVHRARIRYEFYKRFLLSKDVSLTRLQEDCGKFK